MKIKYDFINGEVKKIKPNIYSVIIKDDYDRAMVFCRYQEFYESPYNEIRGKFFTLEKNSKEGYKLISNAVISSE